MPLPRQVHLALPQTLRNVLYESHVVAYGSFNMRQYIQVVPEYIKVSLDIVMTLTLTVIKSALGLIHCLRGIFFAYEN
jgi:hypothetical protein